MPSRGSPYDASLALLLALVVCCGCRTLSGKGPVEPSLASCRQLTQQGISAMQRGQVEQSRQFYEQAIGVSPQNVEARKHLAEALWRQGHLSDAIFHLEHARRLAMDDPVLSVRLGEMYLETGQINRAHLRANDALDQVPEYAQAWALRGRVFYQRGEMELALSDCLRALGYHPNNRAVMALVARIHLRTNRPRRALAVVRGLAETYPHDEQPAGVVDLEGQVLASLGRFHEASQSFANALRRAEPNPELLSRLGSAQLSAGQPAAAAESVQQALALDTNSRPALELAERLRRFSQTASRDNYQRQ